MRSTRGCEAYAIEHNEDRLKMIATNADQLGTTRLKSISGKAPEALTGLTAPDAVFIGGGVGNEGVFEMAWSNLKSGQRYIRNVQC